MTLERRIAGAIMEEIGKMARKEVSWQVGSNGSTEGEFSGQNAKNNCVLPTLLIHL